jgi:hypothetical protein
MILWSGPLYARTQAIELDTPINSAPERLLVRTQAKLEKWEKAIRNCEFGRCPCRQKLPGSLPLNQAAPRGLPATTSSTRSKSHAYFYTHEKAGKKRLFCGGKRRTISSAIFIIQLLPRPPRTAVWPLPTHLPKKRLFSKTGILARK